MTWLVGVLVILLGFAVGTARPGNWTAIWITVAVLWFFVGVGLGVVSIAKLVSGKVGAGAWASRAAPAGNRPAPKTDE